MSAIERYGGDFTDDTKDRKTDKKRQRATPWLPTEHIVDLQLKPGETHRVHRVELRVPLFERPAAEKTADKHADSKVTETLPHADLPEGMPVQLHQPPEQLDGVHPEAKHDDEDEEEDEESEGEAVSDDKHTKQSAVAEDGAPDKDSISVQELMRQVSTDLTAESEPLAPEAVPPGVPAFPEVPAGPPPSVEQRTETASRPAPTHTGQPWRPYSPAVPFGAAAGANLAPAWNPDSLVSAEVSPSPSYDAAPLLAPNRAFSSFQANPEKLSSRTPDTLKLVAGAALVWMLRGYFANKELKKQKTMYEKRLDNERSEQASRLQAAQNQLRDAFAGQQASERPAFGLRPEQGQVLPVGARVELPGQSPVGEQVRPAQQEGDQEIVLQPGQHLDRESWYSVVKDQHGHEVQGAIQYGEAFQREQRQEQAPVLLAASNSGRPPMAGGGTYTTAYPTDPLLPSGQVGPPNVLPPGSPQSTPLDHRLSESRNPLGSTISSPLLWVAIIIWLIVFFVVAFL